MELTKVSDLICSASMRSDVTNCLVKPCDLIDGIKSGRFVILSENPLIVTEQRPQYVRLYYFLTPGCSLKKIEHGFTFPIYADITLRGDPGDKVSVFTKLGLERFRTYQRMGMANKGEVHSKDLYIPSYATAGDAEKILEMLYGAFDPMADTLPDKGELSAMADSGNVLTIEMNGCIAGALLYEDTGIKSYLRALVVSPEYRGVSIGSTLLSHYLALHTPDRTKRFELWVNEENCSALSLYKKYGYSSDGLKNYIFRSKAG